MTHNSVQYMTLYTEHKGDRFRVEIEIRVDDFAKYLAGQAVINKTKRSALAFGKAAAKLVQRC